jgi:DNA-binding CsgD family transcriptional regulator/tetratricopeptide (TPR) repeat protein
MPPMGAVVSTVTNAPPGGDLLERDVPLALLDQALAAVDEGKGRLVLVSGDAGIGKSALVRAFCARAASDRRILDGACDGLRTPRPLGPLVDIGKAVGGELQRAVAAKDAAHSVFDALVDELRSGGDSLVVIEDVHWADEATLDILGLLGRRVESLGSLVVATYRTDELTPAHPLRVVLGDLATAPGLVRVHLEPLSADAVEELAAPYEVDAADLHAKTAGNPFFVTEALASGSTDVPATVRDAVLARAARLGERGRDLLDAVAIVPNRTDLWLLEAIAGNALGALDECLASGMLRAEDRAVAFRHELARRAVEEAINPHRRAELHACALEALLTPPDGSWDLEQLAQHAEAAGDGAAVLEFATAAAEHAAAVGAHREAAAQYARALRYADRLSEVERAALLEARSFECYLISRHDDAIEALDEALECYRAVGDTTAEGLALCSLASRRWCGGNPLAAAESVAQAVRLLEPLGPTPELARAYAAASSMAMNAEQAEPAFAWSERALELIERLGATDTLVFQLNNVGTMGMLLGRPEGLAQLERSIALAAREGLEDDVGRGYIHLAWAVSRLREFALVPRIDAGIEYCADHGLELWKLYLIVYRARVELDQGRFSDAADAATFILRQPNRAPLLKLLAYTLLGTVRARRGDPDVWSPLQEAHEIAAVTDDLQHLAPVAIARTEAASLCGKAALAAEASDAVLELAREREAAWIVGELALWRRRAGIDEPCPPEAAEPFAAHLTGDPGQAAALWRRLGCPYEAALALGDAADGDSLRRALAELRGLGAVPAATLVTRRLRERGERGVARGPRPSTRANPAGLTARELDVLQLLAEGLQNGEIAARLVVSRRTVDHHVSAILRKLGVGTRAQAGAEAARLGLAADLQDR